MKKPGYNQSEISLAEEEKLVDIHIEIETQLREKIKQLKKKSNARRNSLRQLNRAYKEMLEVSNKLMDIKIDLQNKYACSMEINKALLDRNNELLAELEQLKDTQKYNPSHVSKWWKLW